MSESVLVTGGYGFLGRAVARRFKAAGFRVVGIGRGRWAPEEAAQFGFDSWLDAGVSLSSLMTLRGPFSVVAHCGGNGSVGYSLANPLQDFYKTVQGTADLLEYLRLSQPSALLIYPSSAAVYGAKPDAPIREEDELTPISPYGYHKKIVEELLRSYSNSYGLRVAVIRYFSIYGPGLTKQLLWDAAGKLLAPGTEPAVFWGTGEETRDWISAEDAATLCLAVRDCAQRFTILNGASGVRTTVQETLSLLRDALGTRREVTFNEQVREGDPRFYHADVSRAAAMRFQTSTSLQKGIARYASWVTKFRGAQLD
jgi:UDP-glucose 4-epimerase